MCHCLCECTCVCTKPVYMFAPLRAFKRCSKNPETYIKSYMHVCWYRWLHLIVCFFMFVVFYLYSDMYRVVVFCACKCVSVLVFYFSVCLYVAFSCMCLCACQYSSVFVWYSYVCVSFAINRASCMATGHKNSLSNWPFRWLYFWNSCVLKPLIVGICLYGLINFLSAICMNI